MFFEEIPGFSGRQFTLGNVDYDDHIAQYASSTYQLEHNMQPGLVAYPKDKEDIKTAIKYAKGKGIRIACRTGGHQYSGASSTGEENIILDLSNSFRQEGVDRLPPTSEGHVFTSVSWNIKEFNEFLGNHNVFVPHGQCAYVHLGGHVQTGGYGQLARSFGLLGDHVLSLNIIDHEGNERCLTKDGDPDLFFAWLGGSPGNMGVLTHLTIQVHRDADHQGSRGLYATHLWTCSKAEKLLGYLADMNDQVAFPRNYDLCITVVDLTAPIGSFMRGMEKEAEEMRREVIRGGEDMSYFGWIVVYAQWVPFSKDDKPDLGWFKKFAQGSLRNSGYDPKPMSEITKQWIFDKHREYDHPYVKRTYVTKSTTLSKGDWAKWVAGRMDKILKPRNGLFLSSQIQCMGGQNSQVTRNAGNGTAYSWRDATMGMTIDAFYQDESKDDARGWQATNDIEAIGPHGKFSTEDMRYLWGSYGDFDLNKAALNYFDQSTYERIQKARKVADPNGTFTPNTFAVKAAD